MRSTAFDGSQEGPPLGYFVYTVADDHWWWSDGLYALHGYAPREVPATTAVMLSHKHPDDAARTYDVLETAVHTGQPFSCYHRVVDQQGRVRSVLSVGRGVLGTDGTVEQLSGFFIDLTEVRRAETEAEVETALVRIAEHRAVIERAKGMLMFATGCNEAEAFAVLRRHSQNANIKLNQLAHRLMDASSSELMVGDDPRAALTRFLGDLVGSSDKLHTG